MPVGERGLLEPSELWPQERQLCAKAAVGGLLDLRCRRSGEDDPVRGRGWDPHRRIRAQVLFQLLTGHGPNLADSVVAVRLQGAQIVGRLNLGGWKLRCPLELNQCHLRYRLNLAKAEVPNLNLRGSYLRSRLFARRLRVDHTLNLSTGFRCDGGVVLREAHVGGQLDCDEAVFSNPDGLALNADELSVDAGMSLHKAQCTGEVRLPGAQIKGQLDCSEAVFSNPDGTALDGDGLAVGAGMYLLKAQCTGEVRLPGAQIKGQLDCSEAVFSNPDGTALNGDGLAVGAEMYLAQAQCTGEVRLISAHITGTLICIEATFTNPDGPALDGDGLAVDAHMSLRKAQCTGEVRLLDAHIGKLLVFDQSTLTNTSGLAVNLALATVAKAVYMRPALLAGGLDLTRARVGFWHDEQQTWPTKQSPPAALSLEGFVYDAIEGRGATVDERLRYWLPRNSYLPQPYEQLAGVYRREGHEQSARAVAIGKQRARRADVRGLRRLPSMTWSAVLRWTIGYGYRPALALIPLAMLVLAGSLLFLFASQHPDPLHPVLRPAKPGAPEQPAFNSFRYTMDLLLPVVNFKQRDSFIAEGWAAWASFGFTFAGWLLAAVVVAGLSGVFKRD